MPRAMATVTDPPRLAQWWFDHGVALEAEGRFDEAFAAFAKGNALRRAQLDPAGYAELAEQTLDANLALSSQAFFERHRDQGHPSAAPIFVIGMARSGSTLIEQILIAHREIRGMGECNAMARVIATHSPFQPQTPDHYRRLGAEYLRVLRALGWKGSRRVVDKSLGNFLGAPLLKLAFPRATVIHAVRDPLDICFSIFRRNFDDLNPASFDLLDIAREYRLYRRAMDAWPVLMGGDIVEVEHEALVSEPEAQMRRLVNLVGLAWDPACLRFHEARRAVTDGAGAQVRRPLNAEGVGRWRSYRAHLGPLFEALGPLAQKPPGS